MYVVSNEEAESGLPQPHRLGVSSLLTYGGN